MPKLKGSSKVIVAVVLSLLMSGCAGGDLQQRDDAEIRIWHGAGKTLAARFLKNEKQQTVDRIEIGIRGALGTLGEEMTSVELTKLINTIIAYIESYAAQSEAIEKYREDAVFAFDMLRAALVISVEVPAETRRVAKNVRAFLAGALAGIEALEEGDE